MNLKLQLEGQVGRLQGGMNFQLNVSLEQFDKNDFSLKFEVPTGKYQFTTTEYNDETDEETLRHLEVDVKSTKVKGKLRPYDYNSPTRFELDNGVITLYFEEVL
jgi:hypothetical protein